MTVNYRLLSVSCFFLSAWSLFFVGQGNLCFELDNQTIIYLTEMNGTGGDDAIAFKLLALFTLLYAIILFFIKNKALYIFAIILYGVIQYLIFLFIESTSVFKLIVDSIYYCHNLYVLIWLLLTGIFLLLSGLYMVKTV